MSITSRTYPEAFAAMDAAASEFWAYPVGPEWQENFLRQWAQANDPVLLAALEA